MKSHCLPHRFRPLLQGEKKKGQLGGAIGEYKHNLPRLSTLETVENWILRKIGSFNASGKELLTSRDSSIWQRLFLV